MGWRLWRRKKMLPGVTLGLSRSGPSLRLGGRGAGVTLGGRYGVRTTVGVPGTGVYYTSIRHKGHRAAPALRSNYATPSSSRSTAIGCLVVLGILVAIGAVVATSGLVLIPIAIGGAAWIWYRYTRPSSQASRLLKGASRLDPAQALPVVHQAMSIDPGQKTIRTCADWFFAQKCWPDAADAYSEYLHLATDWDAEARYANSLLNAGRLDDAIARLDQLRTIAVITDESRTTMISGLALAWALKGDLQQARSLLDTAGLQKRNLDIGLQQCLMLRAACEFLQGQRAKAIADVDRLYAVNPQYPNIATIKVEMASGSFKLTPAQVTPDWYPTEASPTITPAETAEGLPPASRE